MFTFTNAYVTDNDDVTFNLDFDANDYGLTGQLYMQQINQDSNGAVTTVNSTFSNSITLSPREAVAYIISSSPIALEDFNDLIFKHGFE